MRTAMKGAIAAAVIAPCALGGRVANAQAVEFGAGIGSYALLNGDNVSLYVDQYGDLGAPRNTGNPTKPGGTLNGSGQVIVNPDGSVNTLGGLNTYGMLFSPTSTSTAGSIQASVQAKTEYETLGNRNSVEGYSISVNSGANWTSYAGLGFGAPTFSVTGNSIDGLLTSTSTSVYKSGSTNLQVSQEILFNDASRKNVVQIVTTFTNENMTTALTGLRYARGIDPNQGVTPPGSPGNVNTNQTFGTAIDPTQFAVNSADQTGLNRNLALGVRAGSNPVLPPDLNAAGSTIFAANGGQTETGLLTNPTLAAQGNPSYIRLHADGIGADYVDASNAANDATTSNYQAYLMNPASAPFVNSMGMDVTPSFTSYADTDMVLLSPNLSLAPGASTSFTFYYTFGAVQPSSAVPEPGIISLLFAGTAGVSLLIRRRSRR